jgi:hypothetical protein
MSYVRGCEPGECSVVCEVIRLWARQMRNAAMIPAGARGVRILHLCRRAALPSLFFSVYQRLGYEADHLPPSSAEVKKA